METPNTPSLRDNLIPEIRQAFSVLNDQHLLQEIANHGRCMKFKAGEVIMDYGEYIRMVPLVLEG